MYSTINDLWVAGFPVAQNFSYFVKKTDEILALLFRSYLAKFPKFLIVLIFAGSSGNWLRGRRGSRPRAIMFNYWPVCGKSLKCGEFVNLFDAKCCLCSLNETNGAVETAIAHDTDDFREIGRTLQWVAVNDDDVSDAARCESPKP